MWNDPWWRSLLDLLFVAMTYGKVCLWLWKSLENSGNFFLLLCGHPENVSIDLSTECGVSYSVAPECWFLCSNARVFVFCVVLGRCVDSSGVVLRVKVHHHHPVQADSVAGSLPLLNDQTLTDRWHGKWGKVARNQNSLAGIRNAQYIKRKIWEQKHVNRCFADIYVGWQLHDGWCNCFNEHKLHNLVFALCGKLDFESLWLISCVTGGS